MPSKINSAFYHQFLILSCVLSLCSLNCFSSPSENNILENDTSEEVLEEDTFSVHGTIHDQYNQPITNLFVTASSEFCIPDQTDEQGVFEIRNVEEGEKRLIIYGDTTPDGLVASVSFTFEVENNHVFEAPIKMPRFEEIYLLNEDNSDEYTIATNDGLEIIIAPSALNLAPFSPSELQVARVPIAQSPPFIPEDVELVDLFVLHPILSTLDPPSVISFPNDTELPIDSTVKFYALDYELGKLAPVATGFVDENGHPKTNDGQGIPELTWIGLSIMEEE